MFAVNQYCNCLEANYLKLQKRVERQAKANTEHNYGGIALFYLFIFLTNKLNQYNINI